MKLGFFILLIFIYSASAATYNFYPTNNTFATTLNSLNLQGGDIVNFHAATNGGSSTYDFKDFGGNYNWTGTQGNPITVRAFPGDNVIFTTTHPDRNIIQLAGNYFVFSGFEMVGSPGGTGALAVRLMPGTNNAVIEKLKIHDLYQNAITANTPGAVYSNITFRYNEIYRTSGAGECIYLGCQGQNSSVIPCYIYDSLIEYNYCHDTCLGPAGSCDGGSNGSGYQIKLGSYNNIVRNNVCNNTNTPCILMYDDANRGVNLIEGNVIMNTRSDSGIQICAGAIIRNNIVIGSSASGISLPNNPNNIYQGLGIRNLMIEHNTFALNAANGIKFGVTPTNTTIRNNAFLGNVGGDVWQSTSMTGVTWQNNAYNTGNLPSGIQVNGTIQVGATNTQLTSAATYNVYPLSSSGLLGKGALTQLGYDFNYNARNVCAPTIGAYEFSTSTNPGWTVIAGIKTVTGTQTPCTVTSPCPVVCGAPTTLTPTTNPTTTPSTITPTTPVTNGPTTTPVTNRPSTITPTTPVTNGPTTNPATITPTTTPATIRPTTTPTTSSASSLYVVCGALFLSTFLVFLSF